ncbi:ComEA family DNA-binding protein [Lolliginicoccus suaedae]|uniref:ComEA family DNA-binding protein n=1 Tax=Lolliginicoccus suaedae TaxID=2605429 RepID=UPI0011EC4D35|nr:ComEA family DNA-binding protein [Lolliginicoccus suaedae]
MPYDADAARERFRAVMSLPHETGTATIPAGEPSAAEQSSDPADEHEVAGEGRHAPAEWRTPDAPPTRARIDLSRAGAMALIATGVIGIIIAVLLTRSAAPRESPVPDPASGSHSSTTASHKDVAPVERLEPLPATAAASPSEAPAQPNHLIVSVAGHVAVPGLVTVQPGARVANALAEAGGPLPGADTLTLNLAQPLRDGDHIIVGDRHADGATNPVVSVILGASTPQHARAGETSAGEAAPSIVNANSATAAQLEALPGIGPVTAAAIVQWREANGPFRSIDQLREIRGIGPAKLEQFRDHLTF